MFQHKCTLCKSVFTADFAWKKLCFECWKRSKKPNPKQKWEPPPHWRQPPQKPIIDADMLRRLIYLCHPDKHSNSQASHIATDWLLKQRKP